MTSFCTRFSALALLLLLSQGANGQPIILSEAYRGPFARVSLEPELKSSVGYQIKAFKRSSTPYFLGVSMECPPLIVVENSAYKWNFFARFESQTGKVHLCCSPGFYLAHTVDHAARFTSIGSELYGAVRLNGGPRVKGFFAGWQHGWVTHFEHKAAARETFTGRYSDSSEARPKDGWFGATANRFKFGFAGVRRLSPSLDVEMNIGTALILQKQGILLAFSHAQIPLFISVVLSYSKKTT